ncbi:bifunctional diaminohydroxyphosphoribosylaminopyrimidine deaminase/5-amino-6-(5-phosphoribosylamino)uracil reductase RibD [Rhizobium sp. Root1220]|uniref:bifunctional diaminohydroxyphosphoribosylaminopyrimidine deaminase/5-amino-6-(5-phosphoribosylamino)uracil reductase RibD n=1 Tax=Rhizobium sp. Root1220 TaxID=1736432 RepID=UPI0006F2F6D0|nr:bifunctional diaminohydroxyphosphoribosylaminopyrimidine deaminase/5-amino-6-(5-phosphoribosylamino)uracil reductase RibD [Rhizobium sp. Root1220]KQV82013.1 bifunctional diaminohydroxyphosphoribosylaminopyrimidine deaminase/5-amino-6-(5-phosphoribosylamino)uracil reductase [Rhizobium sp. Root1220]
MSASPDDAHFMQEAIRLGLLHLGQTSINPSVGCVIVRDGKIVGEGTTAIGGRPHAEPQALAAAGELARGATAYVTLEPCSHYGKTPPCSEALIASGIGRVVVSVTDPDPRVSGRGIAMLRDAGIEVDTGVLEEEGKRSLAGYLMRQTRKRPYVTLKLAVSADGMIGRQGEGQVAITGAAARADVQKLRAESDAILVGIGTAIADDPLLTVRTHGLEERSPLRIVLDERLSLPLQSKLVRTAKDVPLVVVAAEPPGFGDSDDVAFLARRAALDAAGAEVVQCNPYRPDELLSALASRGVSSLVIEGGANTAKLFLDSGYVDRILLYQGPATIGEGGIESPVSKTDMPVGFAHVATFNFGDDRLDEYEREV